MTIKNISHIKVDKDVALTLSIYCKLNDKIMVELASEILRAYLKDFDEKLKMIGRGK